LDVKGHLENIANFECREHDVILATYPKSGKKFNQFSMSGSNFQL